MSDDTKTPVGLLICHFGKWWRHMETKNCVRKCKQNGYRQFDHRSTFGLPTWRGYQAAFNGRCVVDEKDADVYHRFFVSLGQRRITWRRSQWLDNLSPPQRPLSCCFDLRLVVRGLGRGKNGSVQSSPLALTLAILFNYFPQKSLRWGEGAERIEMKDQPLPLNFALDLWPCVQFSLGRFLASFGRLSRLRYFALPSLHEG